MVALFLLTGCNPIYSLPEDEDFSLQQEDFLESKGYELPYSLFFVSSHTSWDFEEAMELSYDPATEIYSSEELLLTPEKLREKPFRFKITSHNWIHQFGFTYANTTPIESSFGLKKQTEVLTLKYFSLYCQDMYLKPSNITKPVKLKFSLKIIDKSLSPRALMSVTRSEI